MCFKIWTLLSVRLLLNHWAEFCQTCYITSPHIKRVQKKHYFFLCVRPSVRPSSIHLSVILFPPKPLDGIQQNLLYHFTSWLGCARATFFSVRPSYIHLFVMLSHYFFMCPSIHTSVVHPSVCYVPTSRYLRGLPSAF